MGGFRAKLLGFLNGQFCTLLCTPHLKPKQIGGDIPPTMAFGE